MKIKLYSIVAAALLMASCEKPTIEAEAPVFDVNTEISLCCLTCDDASYACARARALQTIKPRIKKCCQTDPIVGWTGKS